MWDLIRRAVMLASVAGLMMAGSGCESGGGDDDGGGDVSVSGDWSGSYRLGGGGAKSFTMNLAQNGDAITGTYLEGGTAVPISGSRKGADISFFTGLSTSKLAEFDGKIKGGGDAMDGTLVNFEKATGTWRANRN